ncbi:MAG: response regulator [Enterobacterales bacterium]|nr:response regulator [Enterobacterales bacterium]
MPESHLDKVNLVYRGVKHLLGMDHIKALACEISRVFELDYVFLGQLTSGKINSVTTLVAVHKGQLIDNVTYDLENTPCEGVFTNLEICIYPDNVSAQYPKDKFINEMGIESYLGVPIIDNHNQLLGHLIALNQSPIDEDQGLEALFEFFSNQMALELSHLMNQMALSRKNKQLEETQDKLEQAKLVAESQARSKADFMANMSHEIRTPMNGVIGMLSLLEDTELNKDQQSMIDIIKISGDTLLALIDDILDYSKIEQDKIELHFTPIDLHLFSKNIISILEQPASQEGKTIMPFVDDAIKFPVMADHLRLKQILLNLLSNALKFSQSRSTVYVSIKLKHETKTHYDLDFIVMDEGIGIHPTHIDTLFEPFKQADGSITRRFGGKGLGLSICHKLTSLMKGKIKIESEMGKGSTFTVSLCLEKGKTKEPTDEIKDTHRIFDQHFYEQNPCELLVVEDNMVNQQIVMMMLRKLGYQPDLAENGLQAVKMCREKEYDLILMDMQMPVMDGLTATDQILHEHTKRPPIIIAMTANVLNEDRQRCKDVGMSDFLAKPMKIETLAGIIETNKNGPVLL